MKELLQAVRIFVVLAVLTGVLYPLAVTGAAQLFFKDRANGSLQSQNGRMAGSEWIGQSFTQDGYFWGRPSAGNYETLPSAASNLAVTGEQVRANMQENRAKYQNASNEVADELLFTSASGLDPHISPAAARQQAARVAQARGLTEAAVLDIITQHTEPRSLGFLGEPRANVLKLNLALDAQ